MLRLFRLPERVPPVILVLGIGLFALAIRIAFSFVIFPLLSGPLGLGFDPDSFGALAQNWAEGNGYRFSADGEISTYRGPGWPFVLAVVYTVFGSLFPAAVVVQSLIGALAVVATYLIGKHLLGPGAGLAAALAASLHPLLVWYSPRLRYEPLLTLLVALAIHRTLKLRETGAVRDALLTGLFFGLATLVSQIVIFLPLAVIAVLLVKTASKAAQEQHIAVSLFAMIVTIAPWTIRNYQVSGGEFIPVQTGGAMEFVRGIYFVEAYPEMPLRVGEVDYAASQRVAQLLGLDFTEFRRGDRWVDEALWPYALSYVREQPGHFLVSIVVQIPRFWYLSESPLRSWFLALVQGVFLLPAFIGAVHALRTNRRGLWLLIVTVVYFNLVYAAFHAKARFSTPVIPYVIILAVYGLQRMVEFSKKSFPFAYLNRQPS